MQILHDDQGNEVEAMTPDEVDAEISKKVDEKVQDYIKEHPEQKDIIETKKQLDEARAKLEKFENKDYNFEQLRGGKEAAESKVKELEEKITNEIAGVKKVIFDDTYNKTLTTLSNGDDELKKKIEFHYNRLKDASDSREMIEKKLRDSYVLATGSSIPNELNKIISSSGAPLPINNNQGKASISKDVSNVAHKLGLTDDDLKKYGVSIN